MSAKTKLASVSEELLRENAGLRGDLLTIGGRVSHDLLTPLGSISISLQLLKETLRGDNPSVALAMDSLASSANEIKQLVEAVSLLCKATSNPLPKETIAMGAVVSQSLALMDAEFSKRGATVEEPVSWPEVKGVPQWLEFIWRSLLEDTLQRGGLKIQLGWKNNKTELRFWMSDNGHDGLQEARARIFQSFDSLHGLDNAAPIRLSIVRRLVELQRGHCGLETTAGTPRFFFTLPAQME